MKACPKLIDAGRRRFLSGAGMAAAGAAAAVVVSAEARADAPSTPAAPSAGAPATSAPAAVIPSATSRAYPKRKLANLGVMKTNEPVSVSYPDDAAPGILLRLGSRVEGGVGPQGDIVGFSVLCPHKGYPLNYEEDSKTLNCPGHYSVFDCEHGGQQVWGNATQNLAQYVLSVDSNGDIYAEGVDELLYGRLSNVL